MKITGSGSALPAQRITNDMLGEFLDTSDQWITSHTGIKESRVIKNERLSDLASRACRLALEDAKVKAEDIDLVICSNVISDCVTPGLSCFIAGAIGYRGLCLDINGACTGFIQALDLAHSYFSAGKARRILVCAAEKPTHLADWTDRATCVLFGDGAGAVVLEKGRTEACPASVFGTEFNDEFLIMPSKRSTCPFTDDPYSEGFMYMNGQEVYRFAVNACVSDITAAAEKAGIALGDIDLFLLHQANSRIMTAARTRLKLPVEKFPENVSYLGNTSSACIPLLIDSLRRENKLFPGQTLALSAFGAGLTHGAMILKIE